MERAVLYARISLDRTGEEVGVQRQLHDMKALANSRGYQVVEEITDNDISASKGFTRPGYERVWELVRSGSVDHVVAWQSSRLMRSRKDRAEVIDTFGKHNVDVVAVKGPSLDLRSAYGRAMSDMMSAHDTMESEVLSERVSASILDMARRGKAWGHVPYGWDRMGRGFSATQVINEHEATIVRELVDRLLAGESLNALYRDMNGRGEPAPGWVTYMKIPAEVREQRKAIKGRKPPTRLWAKSTIRTLVVRDANVAIRRYRHRDGGGVEMSGDWPAIVERVKHDHLLAMLSAPERRAHIGPRPGARRHLLTSGIGECGVCGGPLRVARRSGKRGNGSKIYLCLNRGGCTGRLQEPVDDLVKRVVIGRLSEPGALDLLLSDDTDAQGLQDRVNELQGRLDEAAISQAAGRINIRALEMITAELQPQIDQAKRERDAALQTIDIEQLRPLIGPGADSAWQAMPVTQRRNVLLAIGVVAVVLDPRTKKGPGFEEETVRFRWKRSGDH